MLRQEVAPLATGMMAQAQVPPGSHVGFFYDEQATHQQALTTYLLDGLTRGERVVYFADEHTEAVLVDYLYRYGVGRYLATGQLQIFEAKQIYFPSGRFQREAMMRLLEEQTQQAMAAGHRGLWATGEMTWALRGHPGSEQLAEYESRLHTIFAAPACRLTAVCQYHRRRFSPRVLLDSLLTHPMVAIDAEVAPNPWFMSPDQFLNADLRRGMMRDWMAEPVHRSQLQETLRFPEAQMSELLEGFVGS